MHLLIYHPNKLSVYNMLMQLLTYNTSGKAVITTANRNQHKKFPKLKIDR